MPLTDGFSCRCKYPGCNKFHNNVDGTGYCKLHQRFRRLFSDKKVKKLEGVMLPL